MELQTFGFVAQPPSSAPITSEGPQTSIRRTQAIRLLWSSWCDAVHAIKDVAGTWTIDVTGTSLTTGQSAFMVQDKELNKALNSQQCKVNFFGSVMHDGLRGYVISYTGVLHSFNRVVLFSTDLEMEAGIPEVEDLSVNSDHMIVDIKVLSARDVLLSTRAQSTGEEQILHLQSLEGLRACLKSDALSPSTHPPLASFVPSQWCINATTSTVLDPDGRVYTFTRDPRYSRCLGRPHKSGSGFELVPYLSETTITKIASGGYMTAAISSKRPE